MKAMQSAASGIVMLAMAALAAGSEARAEQGSYPSRPIEILVGYPAGGSADLTVRVLADGASKILGQPIVVINKPGAGTVVELMALKNAKPDGYTVGTLATAGMINQHMGKVDYDVTRDFTPIIQYAGWIAGLVVRDEAPWKDFRQFLAYAKANPGKVRYSTAGAGTQQHLTMVRLGDELGIHWIHIPYKGGPPAVAAALTGEVEATAQTAEWAQFVQDGKMRLLTTFGTKRTEAFPGTPALSEFGVTFDPPNMLGLVGPRDMPPKAVERLHGAFRKAMEDPKFQSVLERMRMVRIHRGPEEYARFIRELNDAWAPVIRNGMKKDGA